MQKYEMADSETDLRQILWEELHMNQEIKIAVCDDLAEGRENITRLLSEYTDKNNLYVKIEEFSSGGILSQIHPFIHWFYGYFYEWDERYGDGEEADFKKQPGADRVREHQYGVCSRGL